MIRFAVQPRKPTSRLLIDVPTELGSDSDLVPKWLNGFTEDPLVLPGTVCLGTVEERNAALVSRAESADHFRSVRNLGRILAVHVLNAHAYCRNLQLA